MPRIIRSSVAIALALTLALAACSQSGGAPALSTASSGAPTAVPSTGSPASSTSVIVEKFRFMPAELRIALGTVVVWTIRELALHTVTSGTPGHPSGVFDSGAFDTGQMFSFTFVTPGSFLYFCSRHNVMLGLVVVGP